MINLNWMEFNEDSGDKVDVIFIVAISSIKKNNVNCFPSLLSWLLGGLDTVSFMVVVTLIGFHAF